MNPEPLVVVRPHPLCAETPMPVLAQAETPAASVYVRSNFETPRLDAAHAVEIGGAVDRPYAIDLAALAALPQHEVLVTMECAGNWRLGMTPVPAGEPWAYGALSTTTWRGVSLARLLHHAGVQPAVVEVLATAADAGPREDAEGTVRFQRALPLAVALAPDTLVATHMDGAPLTADHGAPVRLIVPGWYGMASVKWLTRLECITAPFTGYFQRQRYVYDTAAGIEAVTTARVKSLIVSPSDQAQCARTVTVQGWAWSGTGPIARVEVQAGSGAWLDVELGTPRSRWAWTPFSCTLDLPAGRIALRSRATDASGAVQPDAIAWNRLGYGNNAVRAITVHVD